MLLVSVFLGGCSMRINGMDFSEGSIRWTPLVDAPVPPSKLKTPEVSEDDLQEEGRSRTGSNVARIIFMGLQYSLVFVAFLYVVGS